MQKVHASKIKHCHFLPAQIYRRERYENTEIFMQIIIIITFPKFTLSNEKN